MPSCTSPRVSASTLPISRVIASAICSFRCTSRSPTRWSTSPRSGAGVLDHCAKPRLADSTARATSSGPDRGKQPMTSFQSAGLRFSKYAPVRGPTHSPAMKFLKFSGMGNQESGVRCLVSSVLTGLRNVGAQPRGLRFGADAREHFPRHQEDAPDDEDLRDDVGKSKPSPPRRNACPHAGGDDRRYAQEVEHHPQPAPVGIGPPARRDADADQHAEPDLQPRPQAARRSIERAGPGEGTGAHGLAPEGRLAPPPAPPSSAEGGVGGRPPLPEPVDLRPPFVPTSFLPAHFPPPPAHP